MTNGMGRALCGGRGGGVVLLLFALQPGDHRQREVDLRRRVVCGACLGALWALKAPSTHGEHSVVG